MKKEGRQHGMVPWLPTAGLLLRVSPAKPTIRSSESRVHHVAGKAKDKAKAKGTHKHRSRDVFVSTYRRLTTWGGPGFKFSGLSATGILDRLAVADYDYDYDNDDLHEESGV